MFVFPDTQWTQLAAATLNGSETGREALSVLYRNYWSPVRRYVLSRGWQASEADDLTQSFFLFAMERGVLGKAERGRGKFRTFLLAVLNHYLLDERDRRRAQKRGGGVEVVPFEDEFESPGYEEDEHVLVFDRQWAIEVMGAAMKRVVVECKERRGEKGSEVIGRFFGVGGDGDGGSYAEAARELGTTVGALRTDVCLWRGKLREALRAEVLRTVAAPHEVDGELTYLRSLLVGV